MNDIPTFPLGAQLPSCPPSEEMLRRLAMRRSTPVVNMRAPGPTRDELTLLLQIASRVPDHRCVVPFRFLVFSEDGRAKFGQFLAQIMGATDAGSSKNDKMLETERLLRAPMVVCVIASPDVRHKTPVWEQTLSVGAVCQNLLLAANAMGYAAQWLTEWISFEEAVAVHLDLTEDERIAGFFYLGTAVQPCKERRRPEMDAIISYYTA